MNSITVINAGIPGNATADVIARLDRITAERPDLVTLESFSVARHTKLWNYDERRWAQAITSWLASQGLLAEPAVADS